MLVSSIVKNGILKLVKRLFIGDSISHMQRTRVRAYFGMYLHKCVYIKRTHWYVCAQMC